MSGRGDRGGRGGGRGRGDGPRGVSPGRGAPRGSSPSGPRGGGGGPQGRGGPPRGRGGAPPPAQPAIAAPAQGPANVDARLTTIDKGVEKFKTIKAGPEHPLRPGFGTAGKAIKLRANFFALKFEKNLIIHEYRIEYSPKTDIARLKGRILELLEQSPQFAQYRQRVAHDKSEKLVSSIELPQPLGIDVTFIDEGETTPRANAKQYHLDIVKTAELDTNDLTK
jgi:eukaryotic translation initiation factor 2C